MKIATYILFAIIASLLFACAPIDQVAELEDAELVQEPELIEQEVMPEPARQVPERHMDVTTQELQAKGLDNTNYRFTYMRLPDGRAETQYEVRNNLVRVEPRMPSTRSVDSIDTVYLNVETREAVGYCERGGINTCQNRDKIADVNFDEYYVELPHEVLARLDNGERIRTMTYRNHVSEVIRSYLDNQQATITIHQFRGTPLKVEFADGTGFEYREISFGVVSEEAVTPPSGW